MDVVWDDQVNAANVLLDGRRVFSGDQIVLEPELLAFVDDGVLTGIEVIDTTQFGTPFDEAAAERAVAHARELLAAPAAG